MLQSSILFVFSAPLSYPCQKHGFLVWTLPRPASSSPPGGGGQDPDQLQLRAVLGGSRDPPIRLATWPKTERDYDFPRVTDLSTTNQIRLIPKSQERLERNLNLLL